MARILCIDDEPSVCALLESALAEMGHETVLAAGLDEALQAVAQRSPDLILCDYRLQGGTGLDLLVALKEQSVEIPVIMMTGYSSVEHAVLCMRHGAVDYLTKPLRNETLRIAVTDALEIIRLRRENEEYRHQIDALRGPRAIVGESKALREVLDTIARVAPTRVPVRIEGESGTGKELFARALHHQSPRRPAPFVTVNCAALPEGLVESALFGHERGSFTGATARALGAFERADKGTLLLDEISEMRLDLQSKLLRAIQEQEIERVGGTEPIHVDVRIVATTNRKLRAEVEANRFRRDLYYRLNVMPIHAPALRERLEDIPLLVQHFVQHAADSLGIRPPEVPPQTIELLKRRGWPGNIRELGNVVERAVILARNGRLAPSVLLESASGLREDALPAEGAAPAAEAPLNLRVLERDAITRALAATGGHRVRAAELLGISERTLRNRLRELRTVGTGT
ncbi:MAG TPA: sigma-54 dependent transcriptional regulator [Terriglobales bacterium]|nr:sigma-54 dependent transcriptional regulator [Terriglobales bacterium]